MRRAHGAAGVGLVTVLVGVACSLSPPAARAYCRTTTCQDCPRDEDSGCLMGGVPVAWPARCVRIGIHAAASEMVDLQTAHALLVEAMSVWNAVRCGPDGLPPSIELLDAPGGPLACGRSEYRADAGNANIVSFRDDAWPYAGAGRKLATTTVRFGDDGGIVDADIEINATLPLLYGEQMSGGGFIPGAHDLLSIFVHEVGHLLGLDHSAEAGSVMQVSLAPRAVSVELSADDEAALCAAYPPDREALPCMAPQLDGFSAQCVLDPAVGGACAVGVPGAAVGSPRAGRAPVLVAALGLLMLAARRRRSP